MKHVFILVCTLFTTNLYYAQSGPVNIQGKISNNTTKNIEITNDNGVRFILPINEKDEVKGFITAERGKYQMKIGEEYTGIFLKPNSSLNFTIDLKEFDESISYTGMLAGENNALAKSYLIDEVFQVNASKYFRLNETEYIQKIDEYLNSKTENLKGHLDESFKTSEMSNIKLARYSNLFMYPGYHKYITKNDSFKPSENFYNFVSEIDFSDENKFRGEHMGIINSFLHYKLTKNGVKTEDDVAYENEKNKLLNASFKSTELKDEYISNSYKSTLKYSSKPTEIINGIIAVASTKELKEEIKSYLDKFSNLAEGKQAPSFQLLNASGSKTALADYKGKYVYIDVWATWCGPCKKELPDYEKLKADYKGKNIEFVSVCVWDSKENWEKFRAEKKLNGEHLFIAGQTNNFTESYMIQGVPTFILIDREGKIISANADRPSSKEVRERLDKLLN